MQISQVSFHTSEQFPWIPFAHFLKKKKNHEQINLKKCKPYRFGLTCLSNVVTKNLHEFWLGLWNKWGNSMGLLSRVNVNFFVRHLLTYREEVEWACILSSGSLVLTFDSTNTNVEIWASYLNILSFSFGHLGHRKKKGKSQTEIMHESIGQDFAHSIYIE